MDRRALVVNLVGGPGAGKSTGAAYIFSKLKMAGVNAELISEFAKEKCWEESKAVFENQIYIFGKQYFKMSKVASKVDVLVTDSPLVLSCLYNPYEGAMREKFDALSLEVFHGFSNLTYFVNRVNKYNPIGRFQDEAGSDAKAKEIHDFLVKQKISFTEINGAEPDYDRVVKNVLDALDDRGLK